MTSTLSRFPQLDAPLRELADRHSRLQDEPLHLALLFVPDRDPADVFLLEVLSNFGLNEASPDGELFEVAYGGTDTLPLSPGQRLHLILTSPSELKAALEAGWESVREVADAVRRGDCEVLFQDDEGRLALERLND